MRDSVRHLNGSLHALTSHRRKLISFCKDLQGPVKRFYTRHSLHTSVPTGRLSSALHLRALPHSYCPVVGLHTLALRFLSQSTLQVFAASRKGRTWRALFGKRD